MLVSVVLARNYQFPGCFSHVFPETVSARAGFNIRKFVQAAGLDHEELCTRLSGHACLRCPCQERVWMEAMALCNLPCYVYLLFAQPPPYQFPGCFSHVFPETVSARAGFTRLSGHACLRCPCQERVWMEAMALCNLP
jgi:hypothetical protein